MSKSDGLGAADAQGTGGMGAGEVPQGPTDSASSTPGGGDVAYDWKQYTNGKGKGRGRCFRRFPSPLVPSLPPRPSVDKLHFWTRQM